jgi:hypothetical protein
VLVLACCPAPAALLSKVDSALIPPSGIRARISRRLKPPALGFAPRRLLSSCIIPRYDCTRTTTNSSFSLSRSLHLTRLFMAIVRQTVIRWMNLHGRQPLRFIRFYLLLGPPLLLGMQSSFDRITVCGSPQLTMRNKRYLLLIKPVAIAASPLAFLPGLGYQWCNGGAR